MFVYVCMYLIGQNHSDPVQDLQMAAGVTMHLVVYAQLCEAGHV